ncbi:MAG TPA: trypsin-like peptidase domain-containing protein [Actinocrinis sp.]|nr:trypsin-like peptidase domain-containing protein [Actinocrinis sp.]
MSQTPDHDITDADEPADRATTPEPAGSPAGAPPIAATAPSAPEPAPAPEPEPVAAGTGHSASAAPFQSAPTSTSTPSAAPAPAEPADAAPFHSPSAPSAAPAPASFPSAGPEHTAVPPSAPEPTAILPATREPGQLPPPSPHAYQAQPYQGPPPGFPAPQPYPGQPFPGQQYQGPPPQYPPQLAPPGSQAGYFGPPGAQPAPTGPGGPAGPGMPPNWATPTTSGLPPYGGPGAPEGTGEDGAEPKKKSGNTRLVLVAAVIAALVGGGVGAGVTYALKDDSSSTSLGSANNNSATSSLNSNSANATAITQVAAKIVPSVVTITVAAADGTGDSGTGIIISSTGQILTNNHVIAAAAGSSGDSLTVTFSSGKITQAKILGADPSSDLAVIQATGATGLTPATLGDSSTVAVGQQVIAIGEPLGLTNTVTSGIVSALNRPVSPESDNPSATTGSSAVLDAIQTDAPINPGNSGGPLVNLQGQVIGIDSAIASDGSDSSSGSQAGSIGLGFAIPINQAKLVAQELIKSGTATHSLLGVSVSDPGATATHTGAIVNTVSAGGPAANAGIKVNDVITQVDNQQVDGNDALVAAIRSYPPGTTVTLTYLRGGQTLTAQVILTTAPATSS